MEHQQHNQEQVNSFFELYYHSFLIKPIGPESSFADKIAELLALCLGDPHVVEFLLFTVRQNPALLNPNPFANHQSSIEARILQMMQKNLCSFITNALPNASPPLVDEPNNAFYRLQIEHRHLRNHSFILKLHRIRARRSLQRSLSEPAIRYKRYVTQPKKPVVYSIYMRFVLENNHHQLEPPPPARADVSLQREILLVRNNKIIFKAEMPSPILYRTELTDCFPNCRLKPDAVKPLIGKVQLSNAIVSTDVRLHYLYGNLLIASIALPQFSENEADRQRLFPLFISERLTTCQFTLETLRQKLKNPLETVTLLAVADGRNPTMKEVNSMCMNLTILNYLKWEMSAAFKTIPSQIGTCHIHLFPVDEGIKQAVNDWHPHLLQSAGNLNTLLVVIAFNQNNSNSANSTQNAVISDFTQTDHFISSWKTLFLNEKI